MHAETIVSCDNMLKLPVYLDNNATTPVDPEVLAAMLPYFTERFGNAASRTHSFGWVAEEAVQLAREQVAGLINAGNDEIVFTSGATEAVNLAIKGTIDIRSNKKHIITCTTEHKAVLDTCKHLEKKNVAVTYLPVDSNGRIDPGLLEASIRPDTALISIMLANNETGVLQPIREVSAIARRHNIWFFTDATQAVGKIPVDVAEQGIDMLCMSAHKCHGPKGVGALYIRRKQPRVRLSAQIDGGGHENGFRSGTLNVPGIVGLGKAAAVCREKMSGESERIAKWRNRLENVLVAENIAAVNGHAVHRLPNTTNLRFQRVSGSRLLTALSKTLAVSAGSACTSANPAPSHVLQAMGIPDDLIKSSIRIGIGRFTTGEEIDYCIAEVKRVVGDLA